MQQFNSRWGAIGEVHGELMQKLRDAEQTMRSLAESNRVLQEEKIQANELAKQNYQLAQMYRLDKLRAEEKSRRQEQLLDEARQKAEENEKQQNSLLSSLTKHLHSVQFRPHAVDDDEVARTMRQLFSGIERWVRINFNDSVQLNMMSPVSLGQRGVRISSDLDCWETVHQRRAFIQSTLAFSIHKDVFSPLFLGIEGDPTENAMLGLEQEKVQQLCPPHVAEHWRLATSMAIESLTENMHEFVRTLFVEDVEWLFSGYSTTDAITRMAQLEAVVDQCRQFKYRLERQEFRFYFALSAINSTYNRDAMYSITGEEGSDSIALSLWPSLWRGTSTNEYLLVEPEQVWVKSDKQVKAES